MAVLPLGFPLTPPELEIKEVIEVIARGFFQPQYWRVLEKVAQYYCTDLLTVIKTALPPGLIGRTQRRIRLLPDLIPSGDNSFLSPIARDVLTLLQGQREGNYSLQYLQRQIRGAQRGVKELLKRGWIESYLEAPRQVRPKQQKAVILISEPLLVLTPTEKKSFRSFM